MPERFRQPLDKYHFNLCFFIVALVCLCQIKTKDYGGSRKGPQGQDEHYPAQNSYWMAFFV